MIIIDKDKNCIIWGDNDVDIFLVHPMQNKDQKVRNPQRESQYRLYGLSKNTATNILSNYTKTGKIAVGRNTKSSFQFEFTQSNYRILLDRHNLSGRITRDIEIYLSEKTSKCVLGAESMIAKDSGRSKISHTYHAKKTSPHNPPKPCNEDLEVRQKRKQNPSVRNRRGVPRSKHEI